MHDFYCMKGNNSTSVNCMEPLQYGCIHTKQCVNQCWNIRLWLAVVWPEGSNEPNINRSIWSPSMDWQTHEAWQMQLQLLLGTNQQHTSQCVTWWAQINSDKTVSSCQSIDNAAWQIQRQCYHIPLSPFNMYV